MRKDGYLTTLSDWLKQHSRQEGQSIQDRAMEVYQQGIQQYDELDAKERALRDEQAKIVWDARFFALLNLDTREAFTIKAGDFDAFCTQYKLKPGEALKVALGEVLEHKRFVRWNQIKAEGKSYKPPRPKHADDELERLNREAKAEQKRLDRLNQELYTLPPVQKTIHFTPNA